MVGGGGVCCGCGGKELVGCKFEPWLGFSFLCRLEILMLSCAGAGGGWCCFFPGLQRRTGENISSEQTSEIFEMGS